MHENIQIIMRIGCLVFCNYVNNIADYVFFFSLFSFLFFNIMESIQPWYVDLRPMETPPPQQVTQLATNVVADFFQWLN